VAIRKINSDGTRLGFWQWPISTIQCCKAVHTTMGNKLFFFFIFCLQFTFMYSYGRPIYYFIYKFKWPTKENVWFRR